MKLLQISSLTVLVLAPFALAIAASIDDRVALPERAARAIQALPRFNHEADERHVARAAMVGGAAIDPEPTGHGDGAGAVTEDGDNDKKAQSNGATLMTPSILGLGAVGVIGAVNAMLL